MKTTSADISIFNGEYEIMEKLGEGLTSIVYHGRKIQQSETVAIKIFKTAYAQSEFDMVQKEIQIQSKIDHPNFIKIFENGSDGYLIRPNGRKILNLTYIIMEVATEGTLFKLVDDLGKLPMNTVRYLAEQVLEILTTLEKSGISHRDIKLENLLLDQNMKVKLTDFGFACDEDVSALTTYHGTQSYTAPEILERKTYNGLKSDIFSCGVILYILATGNFPFSQAKIDNINYSHIHQERLTDFWTEVDPHQRLEQDFRLLVQSMLAYDMDKRLSIDEIGQEPFMTASFKNEQERINLLQLISQDQSTNSSAGED